MLPVVRYHRPASLHSVSIPRAREKGAKCSRVRAPSSWTRYMARRKTPPSSLVSARRFLRVFPPPLALFILTVFFFPPHPFGVIISASIPHKHVKFLENTRTYRSSPRLRASNRSIIHDCSLFTEQKQVLRKSDNFDGKNNFPKTFFCFT